MSDLPKDVVAAAMRALMVPGHDMVESAARAIEHNAVKWVASIAVAIRNGTAS